MDFRYPKPLRFNFGELIKGKKYLSLQDERYLLSGKVVVEEKMDGKQTMMDTEKFVLWAEDMRVKHSIAYRIPARFAVFDVVDKNTGIFLPPEEKVGVVRYFMRNSQLLPPLGNRGGIFPIPRLEKGFFTKEELAEMVEISSYAIEPGSRESAHMEGIVVKPYRELFIQEHISGKIVRKEFLSGIEDHYLSKPQVLNEIDPSLLLSNSR